VNESGRIRARQGMFHPEDMKMQIFKYMGTTLVLSLTLQAGFYLYCVETLAH